MRWLALLFFAPACALATPLDDLGRSESDSGVAAKESGVVVLPDGASSLPECSAQRVVHIVAGNGGFAWFTQIWPVPFVIQNFATTDAFDVPTRAVLVSSDTAHPLYERAVEGTPGMAQTGTHPLLSVWVAGTNETHTLAPDQTKLNGVDVIAYATAAQASQKATVPTIVMSTSPIFGGAATMVVGSTGAAVDALESGWNVPPAAIAPDPTKLASWYGTTTPLPNTITNVASALLFAANAFRGNYASTIVLPAFDDDPNGAFANPDDATLRSDALAQVLDHFYLELAQYDEPTCSHHGRPLSLADNVVLVVTGDTPKDPFMRAGWPDNTPGNANWIYARSNGWLKPGWFGVVDPTGRTGFDPTTGIVSATSPSDDKNSAASALLYAIARGNGAFVATIGAAPYGGLIATASP